MQEPYLIIKKKDKNMVKVMVFGAFDIFHPGHINFLEQARQYGDYLIVVIARDITVKNIKGAWPSNNEKDRLEQIKNSGLANKVILGNLGDKYRVIVNFNPDIICLGYDQNSFTNNLYKELKRLGLSDTKIIRLNPYKPEIYKSSKLK